MKNHPIALLIERADKAINQEDFVTVVDLYAEDAVLVIEPGSCWGRRWCPLKNVPVIERKDAYVFKKDTRDRWLCAIGNPYGHEVLEASAEPFAQPTRRPRMFVVRASVAARRLA